MGKDPGSGNLYSSYVLRVELQSGSSTISGNTSGSSTSRNTSGTGPTT